MLCPAAFRKKGTSSRFLTHNFSCRRVNVLFLWCYVLTHKFSFHCEKDCLRSPDCEKTGQLATRKRYASERACFRPSTAQIPVKIYRSNAKSYSTNDRQRRGEQLWYAETDGESPASWSGRRPAVPPPLGPAYRVGCPGTAVYGSHMVIVVCPITFRFSDR